MERPSGKGVLIWPKIWFTLLYGGAMLFMIILSIHNGSYDVRLVYLALVITGFIYCEDFHFRKLYLDAQKLVIGRGLFSSSLVIPLLSISRIDRQSEKIIRSQGSTIVIYYQDGGQERKYTLFESPYSPSKLFALLSGLVKHYPNIVLHKQYRFFLDGTIKLDRFKGTRAGETSWGWGGNEEYVDDGRYDVDQAVFEQDQKRSQISSTEYWIRILLFLVFVFLLFFGDQPF